MSRRRSGPLAARLTAWYAIVTFVLIAFVTGYLFRTLDSHIDEVAMQFVIDELQIIRKLLADESPGDWTAIRQEVELESESRQYGRFYTRIIDPAGRRIAESPGFPPEFPPSFFSKPVGIEDEVRPRSVTSRSGRVYRVLSAEARLGGGASSTYVVHLVLDWSRAEDVVTGFRRRIIPFLAFSLLVCVLVGYGIARKGTASLEKMAEATQGIGPNSLADRIVIDNAPSEITTLADRFNEMLERLEESFDRLERFSSDIAHELRTPLGNLRGEIEVTLSQPREVGEYRDALESSLEEAVRLSRLVDQLLFLARSEHPASAVTKEEVILQRELGSIAEYYEGAASDASVTIDVNAPRDLTINFNRELFQRSIANLLDNALAFTPVGGRITLRATRVNESIYIEVEDTGCGIGGSHLPHVFERLYQADASRSEGEGAGLGLTIVKTITGLHGGEVEITSNVGLGTRVRLRFPT